MVSYGGVFTVLTLLNTAAEQFPLTDEQVQGPVAESQQNGIRINNTEDESSTVFL